MIWQDLVITLANILFSVSLIPQVLKGFKDKKGHIVLAASIPTVIGLYAMSFTFFTLNLFFSSVVSFISGSLWLTLLSQKILYK